MWRLWNKLFGWDYVVWSYKHSDLPGDVSRIIVDQTGTPYIHEYSEVYRALSDASKIIWLTCKPEKYLKERHE